jgi:hypothetical protein
MQASPRATPFSAPVPYDVIDTAQLAPGFGSSYLWNGDDGNEQQNV